jgi:hypothetical protein
MTKSTASRSPCRIGTTLSQISAQFPTYASTSSLDILTALRAAPTASTSSSAPTCSAHPVRPGTCGLRHDRHRANINPERLSSTFEPVHGSANIAEGHRHPSQIWSGAHSITWAIRRAAVVRAIEAMLGRVGAAHAGPGRQGDDDGRRALPIK